MIQGVANIAKNASFSQKYLHISADDGLHEDTTTSHA